MNCTHQVRSLDPCNLPLQHCSMLLWYQSCHGFRCTISLFRWYAATWLWILWSFAEAQFAAKWWFRNRTMMLHHFLPSALNAYYSRLQKACTTLIFFGAWTLLADLDTLEVVNMIWMTPMSCSCRCLEALQNRTEPTAVANVSLLQEIVRHISFTTLHFRICHDVITSNEDLKKYRDPEIQSLQNAEVPFHPDHCGDRRKCLQSQWRVVGSLLQKNTAKTWIWPSVQRFCCWLCYSFPKKMRKNCNKNSKK